VLLPPAQQQKVLVLGGGKPGGDLHEPATATTAVVDLRKQFPAFRRGPDLSARKRYVSAVILPDRTVLQTGGSALYRNAGADVLDAQLYNPWTNKLTGVASPTVGRNYHSEALLLPDGRVATFGGNPLDNSFEQRIEVYSPPYLYRGQRPAITAAPTAVGYGTAVTVRTSQAAPLRTFALVRPSAVTHSTDTEQRLVDVPFQPTPTGARLAMPRNPNIAPPGWYMLFALDAKGVPSVASWVRLG
jgi:hypothetical protein